MIFIIDADKDKMIKKYKELTYHSKNCPACKKELWENGTFEFFVSKEHRGFIRACNTCKESQTLLTPKKLNDQIKLRNTINNLKNRLGLTK